MPPGRLLAIGSAEPKTSGFIVSSVASLKDCILTDSQRCFAYGTFIPVGILFFLRVLERVVFSKKEIKCVYIYS